MFSVFRNLRIPSKATSVPQYFFFFWWVSSLHIHLLSILWISRWRGLSCDPRNEVCDPSTSLGKWDLDRENLQIYKCHYKQTIDTQWGCASLADGKPLGLAWDRNCFRPSQLHRGTTRDRMIQSCLPSLPFTVGLATLWTQSRMQHPWCTAELPCLLWCPQLPGPCFWWPCFKERWWENGKSTVVTNKLKRGTVEGKILNMWCSIWACWVNMHYSIPQQNTGKAAKGEDSTVESLQNLLFPLLCSGRTCRGLSAHSEDFFPSYKSYLSFQTLPFPRKPFGQPFQFLFNKWSSLKLPVLQEQFWENRWLCTLLKIPASQMACADTTQWC